MTNDNDYMTDEFGFRFRTWDIYRDARQFRSFVNGFLKTYPSEERFALTDQTKRALNSVVLNIAEGANRMTDKDTRLYMNRAHTSLDETVACSDCGLDDGYLTVEQHTEALSRAASLAKRLQRFSKHLSRS